METLCDGIVGNTTLLQLGLCKCTIRADHIHPLCNALNRNSHIKHLDLTHCDLADAGIVALCKGLEHNRTIRALTLTRNAMGDEGAAAITTLISGECRLTGLGIEKCKLQDHHIVGIAAALASNTSLRDLRLISDQEISQESVQILLNGIKANTSLTKLSIPKGFNDVQRDGVYFCVQRNRGATLALTANLNLWDLVLTRADKCRRRTSSPPDMLYYFVRERCDVFRDW